MLQIIRTACDLTVEHRTVAWPRLDRTFLLSQHP